MKVNLDSADNIVNVTDHLGPKPTFDFSLQNYSSFEFCQFFITPAINGTYHAARSSIVALNGSQMGAHNWSLQHPAPTALDPVATMSHTTHSQGIRIVATLLGPSLTMAAVIGLILI